MAGNSIGTLFRVTTAGESHGPALTAIIDGCPARLPLSEDDFILDMERRARGKSKYTTKRREPDQVKILSGVYNGLTTGTPITLQVLNTDTRSQDYDHLLGVSRPGHADFTYQSKYGIRDHRGGGRSSARETAVRVAAGVVAKKFLLLAHGIKFTACVSQVGLSHANYSWDSIDREFLNNNLFAPNEPAYQAFTQEIEWAMKNDDSVGARVDLIIENVPSGLGEPIFSRLNADLAHALMNINAVRGVEFGAGFKCVEMHGSNYRDPITPNGFSSNNEGGTLGGISTGQDILVSLAIKPTSSIPTPIQTINDANEPITLSVKGRHDPCVGIRAVPVVEAMAALVIADHLLRSHALQISLDGETK